MNNDFQEWQRKNVEMLSNSAAASYDKIASDLLQARADSDDAYFKHWMNSLTPEQKAEIAASRIELPIEKITVQIAPSYADFVRTQLAVIAAKYALD